MHTAALHNRLGRSERRMAEMLREQEREQAQRDAVRAACPRTSVTLDAAWDRLNTELDEGVRARLSDFIFVLGVCQASRTEMTQEEALQAFALLAGDLR